MKKEMPKIIDCNATSCVFNLKNKCHAFAITVGGEEECPLCDTGIITEKKGGIPEIFGCVGACKVDNCVFNDIFKCAADGIHVRMHSEHAECATYKMR